MAFYLYEAAGGMAYTPDVIRAILSIKGVVGIKVATLDSVMTYQDVLAAVHARDDTLAITGEDRYRPTLWLKRRTALGLPIHTVG